jgi:sRNA-binding regulator protein Hfq
MFCLKCNLQSIASYIYKHKISSYIYRQDITSYIYKHNITSYIYRQNIASYIYRQKTTGYIYRQNTTSYIYRQNTTRCLSFGRFSFGHCIVCPSLIYGFWLSIGNTFDISKLFLLCSVCKTKLVMFCHN